MSDDTLARARVLEASGPWTAEMTITGWVAYEAALTAEGFRAAGEHITRLDQPIAEAARCGHCGRALVYAGRSRPYRGPLSRGVYRAFAVCMACDLASEF